MAHSWTFDAPSGVYKNHQMSSKLRMAAIAECKFMQFVKPEAGYGKKKGESITITRVSNITIPTDARLSENSRIPEDEVVLSTISITVTEWGRSIPYTSLAQDLGSFDVENVIQKKLRDQMALVLDKAAANAFKSAKVKATPSSSSALTIATNGVAGGTAAANLSVAHVEAIRDYMYSTLNIPAYEGDDYICLISTKAKRGILNDTNFEKWHQYISNENKLKSEIGRLENIRFVEINNVGTLNNAMGSGGVLGEAVFFGDDAVAMAVAEDPELRAELPKDFGRVKSVAWYGILEFGMIWDTANAGEARIVHLTSL